MTNDLLETLSSLIIPQTLKQARLPLVPRDTCKRSYRDLLSLVIASRNACVVQGTLEVVLTLVEVIAEDRWSVTGMQSGI